MVPRRTGRSVLLAAVRAPEPHRGATNEQQKKWWRWGWWTLRLINMFSSATAVRKYTRAICLNNSRIKVLSPHTPQPHPTPLLRLCADRSPWVYVWYPRWPPMNKNAHSCDMVLTCKAFDRTCAIDLFSCCCLVRQPLLRRDMPGKLEVSTPTTVIATLFSNPPFWAEILALRSSPFSDFTCTGATSRVGLNPKTQLNTACIRLTWKSEMKSWTRSGA